jgi:hypothetical protein
MNKAHLANRLDSPQVAAGTDTLGDASNDPAKRGRPPKGGHSPKYDSRIQVKLTPAGRARLDEIVARVDAAGFAEVVRDELRVYDILTEEVFVHGNEFLSRDRDTGVIERLTFWHKAKSGRLG